MATAIELQASAEAALAMPRSVVCTLPTLRSLQTDSRTVVALLRLVTAGARGAADALPDNRAPGTWPPCFLLSAPTDQLALARRRSVGDVAALLDIFLDAKDRICLLNTSTPAKILTGE